MCRTVIDEIIFLFAISVSYSSVPPHLGTMLKQLLHRKYSATHCSLFVELNICTSEFIPYEFQVWFRSGIYVYVYWHCWAYWHYRYNVFQIAFIVLAALTFVYYVAFVSHQPSLLLSFCFILWVNCLCLVPVFEGLILFLFLNISGMEKKKT